MSTAAKIRKQLFARAGNEAARLAYERTQKDKHSAKVTEQQFLARHPEILMEELAIEAKRKALLDDEIVKYFRAHPKLARDIIKQEAAAEVPKARAPSSKKDEAVLESLPVLYDTPILRARTLRGRSVDPVIEMRDALVAEKTPLAGARAKRVVARAKAAAAPLVLL